MTAKTLYDKLWDAHLVQQRDDGSALIYIDRHIVHEVTSPQAFDGLRLAAASLGVWIRSLPRRITTFLQPRKNVHMVLRELRTRCH